MACMEMCVYMHSVYMRYRITSAKELRGGGICMYILHESVDRYNEGSSE